MQKFILYMVKNGRIKKADKNANKIKSVHIYLYW